MASQLCWFPKTPPPVRRLSLKPSPETPPLSDTQSSHNPLVSHPESEGGVSRVESEGGSQGRVRVDQVGGVRGPRGEVREGQRVGSGRYNVLRGGVWVG